MAQKRYFDYQSKIKSKTSAEAMALASAGIGVKYGFNKVSVSGNNTFIISSDNTITLTNSDNGALDEVKHVVITPDGIIAAETEDIRLTLSDSSNLTEGSYFVLASHQHIESIDTIVATSYTLVKGNISLISELINPNINIDNWYTKLSSIYTGLNRNTTVIVALIEYHSNSNIQIYNPYNDKWPTDKIEVHNYIIQAIEKLNFTKYGYVYKEYSKSLSDNPDTILDLNLPLSNNPYLIEFNFIIETYDHDHLFNISTPFLIPPMNKWSDKTSLHRSFILDIDSLGEIVSTNSLPSSYFTIICVKTNSNYTFSVSSNRGKYETGSKGFVKSLKVWYKKMDVIEE